MLRGSKKLILMLLMIPLGLSLYGQELTVEIANNIKYGRTQNLTQFTTAEKINGCLSVKDSKKYGFLAISIKLKSMKSLQFFVDNGADVEQVCADKTPLMYAAKYGQFEMVKYLVESGADPDTSIRGYRAINYARRYHYPEIAKYLKKQEYN